MATVTFDKAQRWYPGADVPAVPGIDVEIKEGEFMVLVGLDEVVAGLPDRKLSPGRSLARLRALSRKAERS